MDAIGILFVFLGVLGTVVLLFFKFQKFAYDQKNLMPEEYFKKNWELQKTRFEKGKEHLEKGFEIVLVIGLALELWAFPHHILESARLNKEAGYARKEAGEAIKQGAKFSKDAEELRTANLALEREIQPRRITPEKKAVIIRALNGLLPSTEFCQVEIKVPGTDFEARTFAWQIGHVVADNFRIHVHIDENIDSNAPIEFGLRFFTHDPPPTWAIAIEQAFGKAGIDPVVSESSTNTAADTLMIRIGPKPME